MSSLAGAAAASLVVDVPSATELAMWHDGQVGRPHCLVAQGRQREVLPEVRVDGQGEVGRVRLGLGDRRAGAQ